MAPKAFKPALTYRVRFALSFKPYALIRSGALNMQVSAHVRKYAFTFFKPITLARPMAHRALIKNLMLYRVNKTTIEAWYYTYIHTLYYFAIVSDTYTR
jgi:hypothetical protein